MLGKYTEKQLDILETTIKYLSINGIQSFSLRNIASLVGIKQPTLYGHFQSKEDILKGVFDLYKYEITKYYEELAALNVSKLEKIKMYFFKMCELIQHKTDYMNLVMFELYQYRDIFKNDFNSIFYQMTEIIEKSFDDEKLQENSDYNFLLTIIYGMIHVYLKNKLLIEDFDVLSNAEIFWEKLEEFIKS